VSEELKKWFRKDNLLVLILAGILVFVIALPTEKKTKNTENGKEEVEAQVQIEQKDYVTELERRLQDILEQMEGVGRAQVLITLQTSEELVVEKDLVKNHSATDEEDDSGGIRTITQLQNSESTVYETQSGESAPYVIKTIFPKVEGVVVAAQGAGEGTVNKNITEMVETLFGVEAHKVKVVKLKRQN